MSNADWFARKLGQQPQQPQQPMAPTVPPNLPPAFAVQTPPATYRPQQNAAYPPSVQVTPASPTCPACHSGNYSVAAKQITQNGQVESWRCYDCGYPLVQAGSTHGGANSAPSAGPAQRSKQVPTGGWNPTTIIGHI